MKRHYIVPALILGIAGATAFGVLGAQADDTTSQPKSMVQRISQKFNLKESDVQTVFDEAHTERHATMQKKAEERLTQLVKDGKLTETQKQAILTKQQELEKEREAAKDKFASMTGEERKAEKEKQHTNLEQWAKDNGIDLQYLHSGFAKIGGKFGAIGKSKGHGPR